VIVDGAGGALWLAGFLLGVLAIAVPVALLGFVAFLLWSGPLAHIAMRMRAWWMIHRLRS
jgi:hypothetical protein